MKALYATFCWPVVSLPLFDQVAAPRTVDPSTLPKPTKDFSVFRDAKTYCIQENPNTSISICATIGPMRSWRSTGMAN